MELNVFVTMLVLVSGLTTLTVEAIKASTDTKKPSLCAVIVAVILSALVGATYPILFNKGYDIKYFVMCCWLVILSAISSQVGYDKIKILLSEVFGA